MPSCAGLGEKPGAWLAIKALLLLVVLQVQALVRLAHLQVVQQVLLQQVALRVLDRLVPQALLIQLVVLFLTRVVLFLSRVVLS